MINKATSGTPGNRGRNFANKPGRRDASRNAADAGFTLVELLVVLLLTAVMTAMMIGGIRQMHTFMQIEKRQAAQAELDAVADYMASELAGALPLPLDGHDGDGFVPMIGDADSIRFVAVARTGISERALREISYSVDQSSFEWSLVRKLLIRRRLQKNEFEYPNSEERYRGIETVTLAYLKQTNENKIIWRDEWRETRLPLAIRIQFSKLVNGLRILTFRTVVMEK